MHEAGSQVGITSISSLLANGSQLQANLLEGSYRIERFQGEGQTGHVYQVTHIPSLGHYALRSIRPEYLRSPAFRARLRTEASRLSQLRHDHAISLVDWYLGEDDQGYLVTEWVDGETLGAYLDSLDRSVPLKDVQEFCRQIGAALETSHGMGISHGALNPANIFRIPQPDGSTLYRTCDFALALLMQLTDPDYAPVYTGIPAYISPEQARRELRLFGPRSDQFALAAIIYEMLTPQRKRGYCAFVQPGDSPAQVLHRIMDEDPTPLALPEAPAIEAAIGRALNRARERRFPLIGDFVRQICPPPARPARSGSPTRMSSGGYINQKPTLRTSTVPGVRAVRWPRLTRRMAGVLVALSFIIILGSPLVSHYLGSPHPLQAPSIKPPEAKSSPPPISPIAEPLGPQTKAHEPKSAEGNSQVGIAMPSQRGTATGDLATAPPHLIAPKGGGERGASKPAQVFVPSLTNVQRTAIQKCLGPLPRSYMITLTNVRGLLRVAEWHVSGQDSGAVRECFRDLDADPSLPAQIKIRGK